MVTQAAVRRQLKATAAAEMFLCTDRGSIDMNCVYVVSRQSALEMFSWHP